MYIRRNTKQLSMGKDFEKKVSKKKLYKSIDASEKSFDEKHEICMSIMISYLKIYDTIFYMNEVINVANKKKVDIWSLEEHFNPIDALFLLCEIEDENYKDILFNLIYTKASERIGDKDFDGRAEGILAQMENTIRILSTT